MKGKFSKNIKNNFVQSIHGLCPDFPLIPWTSSRESMELVDNLQIGIQHFGSLDSGENIDVVKCTAFTAIPIFNPPKVTAWPFVYFFFNQEVLLKIHC